MTAQYDDIVRYRRANYSIAGIDGDGLFDPAQYGMKPVSWCSACWGGYLTSYQVKNRQLYLSRLEVCLTEPGSGEQKDFRRTLAPVIEGRTATDLCEEEGHIFEYLYDNMNLPVPFTGGLLLAKDFIEELYVHMGFHPAWKYLRVHELLFEKGHLTRASDVSQKMTEFRSKTRDAELRPGFDGSVEKMMTWIDQCFSRDYKLQQ